MLQKLKDALEFNGFSMSETENSIKIFKKIERISLFDSDFEEYDESDKPIISKFEVKKTDIEAALYEEYKFKANPLSIYNENYFEVILTDLSKDHYFVFLDILEKI